MQEGFFFFRLAASLPPVDVTAVTRKDGNRGRVYVIAEALRAVRSTPTRWATGRYVCALASRASAHRDCHDRHHAAGGKAVAVQVIDLRRQQ